MSDNDDTTPPWDEDAAASAAMAVNDAFENAEKAKTSKETKPRRSGKRASAVGFESMHLPEGCPIKALGHKDGAFYYFNRAHELRILGASQHTRLEILSLFGGDDYLRDVWPRMNDDGKITGWQPDAVASSMIKTCYDMGVVDVKARERGPGAWLDDEDRLVMHCGNRIYSHSK